MKFIEETTSEKPLIVGLVNSYQHARDPRFTMRGKFYDDSASYDSFINNEGKQWIIKSVEGNNTKYSHE